MLEQNINSLLIYVTTERLALSVQIDGSAFTVQQYAQCHP
jgi:hypothetical protein